MNANQYSVVIAQRFNADGTFQSPIVEDLICHEGDMEYLAEAVNSILEPYNRPGGRWMRIPAYGYKGSDYAYRNAQGDEVYIYVRTPYGGWNI